jgi:hypothetical protein
MIMSGLERNLPAHAQLLSTKIVPLKRGGGMVE